MFLGNFEKKNYFASIYKHFGLKIVSFSYLPTHPESSVSINGKQTFLWLA